MRHCCKFKPDDTYYLKETNLYIFRMFSIGFCPICGKPVAELYQVRFDGKPERNSWAGFEASQRMEEISEEILYSVKNLNYKKMKSRPFGWKYGINKDGKQKGKSVCRQYACDFYGNKELIKTVC